MKLIVDISEDTYTRLFDNGIQDNEIAVDDVCEMARALRTGTPLPKGHGRILDEKDILDTENNDGGWYDLVDMPEYVAGVKAIIEADKAKYGTEDEEYEMVDLGYGLFEKRYLRKK